MNYEQIRPDLERYDIHHQYNHIRDMRLKVLAQMAVHEARRHGKAQVEYDGLEIEVEMLHTESLQ